MEFINTGVQHKKVAVCYEFGKQLVVDEVDLASPKVDEIRVKISATSSITPMFFWSGMTGGKLPTLAGHESAGIFAEAGAGVINVRPGDWVGLRCCAHAGIDLSFDDWLTVLGFVPD